MKLKNKKVQIIGIALFMLGLSFVFAQPTYAQEDCSQQSTLRAAEACEERNRQAAANQEIQDCSQYSNPTQVDACEAQNEQIRQARNNGEAITTARANGAQTGEFASDCESLDKENCGITRYLVLFINTLTAIAGLVIVIMIVWGGIQYSAARDNPQAAAAAKGKITNAVLALVFYIFASAFLQWLVPGGVF